MKKKPTPKPVKNELPRLLFKPEAGWIVVLPIFTGKEDIVKSKSGILLDTAVIKRDNLERGTVIAAQGLERGTAIIYLKYGYEKILEGGNEFVLLNEERLIGVYDKPPKKEDLI